MSSSPPMNYWEIKPEARNYGIVVSNELLWNNKCLLHHQWNTEESNHRLESMGLLCCQYEYVKFQQLNVNHDEVMWELGTGYGWRPISFS